MGNANNTDGTVAWQIAFFGSSTILGLAEIWHYVEAHTSVKVRMMIVLFINLWTFLWISSFHLCYQIPFHRISVLLLFLFPNYAGQCLPYSGRKQPRGACWTYTFSKGAAESDLWLCFHVSSFSTCFGVGKFQWVLLYITLTNEVIDLSFACSSSNHH